MVSPTLTGVAQGGYYWQNPEGMEGKDAFKGLLSLTQRDRLTTYSLVLESGYREGQHVTPHYDPLLAKLADPRTIGLNDQEAERIANEAVPIYYVTGWYDIFEYGNLHNFMALSKLHKSPTRLLVGPWTHNVGPRFSGDVDFDAAKEIAGERRFSLYFIEPSDILP